MKYLVIIFFIYVTFIPCSFAKRLLPTDVSPVIFNGIKYTVTHFNRPQNSSYIEARDSKTDKLIYKFKIYSIEYDEDMESDVQDIFITKIEILNKDLIVWNEVKDKFTVNLSTKQVKPTNKIYKYSNKSIQRTPFRRR